MAESELVKGNGMQKEVRLSGRYVQVRRSRDGSGSSEDGDRGGSGNAESAVTYGGNQNFFADLPGAVNERKRRQGCGITAFADLMLYLGSRSDHYITRENENYVNRVLSVAEYRAYYDLIYKFMGGIPPWMKNGLSFVRMQSSFNRMARRYGWRLRAMWGMSGRKLWGRMEEMLAGDIPVILCIPFMLRRRDRGRGITFYRRENHIWSRACTVSAHYVVVTGIVCEGGEAYLELSSWGEKYYVSREEYFHLISTSLLGIILGNILYIRSF